MRRRPVLLVALKEDPHVQLIKEALARNGLPLHYLELGHATSAYSVHLSASSATIEWANQLFDDELATASSLIFLNFAVNDPPWIETEDDFSRREWSTCLRSIFRRWSQLNTDGWSIGPDALFLQNSKPLLLQLASDFGCEVPAWQISMMVQRDLRADESVLKAINAWQEVAPGQYFNTTVMTHGLIESASGSLSTTPLLVQDRVHHTDEVRLYLTHRGSTAVRITRLAGNEVDFRLLNSSTASVEPVEVDRTSLVGPLRRLMKQLSISYCCFDIALMGDDRQILLDVNPAGSWAFLQADYKLDITEHILEILT